ncbi:TIGR02642 family protein [Enterovibrio norvegicus]|uniref:TIGR02642 family protein n=1 Tax=Enterovibrio norvegicus TaxID=188144 RepID=UPI0002FA0A75|nr:TIGR02642 family protein [Enterovibrio norvegicus]
MSRAIELLIRMHSEKTPSMQRGRATLTGDVILGVLGKLQHEHPIGSDAIMWRWLNDMYAFERLQKKMEELIPADAKRKDLCKHMVTLALMVFAEKPLEPQQRKLTSLWKNHSEQARRSKRLMRTWQVQINVMEKQLGGESAFKTEQLVAAIEKRKQWIVDERERLEEYAKAQAKKSCQCPKCGGTGVTRVVDTCSGCGGSGGVTLKADGVRKHLRMAGIEISEVVWRDECEKIFEGIVMSLFQRSDHLLGRMRECLLEEAL